MPMEGILFSSAIIILTSYLIYKFGDLFTEASSDLGEFLKLSKSVKGATIDAIASSLPELMTSLFAVLFFKKFEVGIGTIVGSALFNVLVIPGIAVLVSPVVFKIGKEVINRDALFYIGAVIALIIAIYSSSIWRLIIPSIFLAGYGIYVFIIAKDVKKHRKENMTALKKAKKENHMSLKKTIITIAITMIIIAAATFFLTQSAIGLAESLSIPAFIVAFIVIAAATSVPDAVISILNAKKGDVDDATSNVFGSNIFDILIGLAIPLIIAYFIIGSTTIIFEQMELLWTLLASTLIVYFIMLRTKKLTKTQGWLLLGMYLAIISYTIFISLNL